MTVFTAKARLSHLRVTFLAAGLLVAFAPVGARVLTPASVADAAPRQTVNCDVDAAQLAPSAVDLDMLAAINLYRAASGLGPLAFDTALQRAAVWKANYMAQQKVFAHDDQFRNWIQRTKDCGYPTDSVPISENLAGALETVDAAMAQWQGSTIHNGNLLSPAFTAVGIRRVQAQADDPLGWYWIVVFGNQVIQPLATAVPLS
jgi:uncharacterized protein YkwD